MGRELVGLVSILALLVGHFAWADGCPALLTTSFGFNGSFIVTLDREAGELRIINDGSVPSLEPGESPLGDGRIPRFKDENLEVAMPFRPAKSLASIPDSQEAMGFHAWVAESGVMSLTLPDNRTYSVRWTGDVDAVALYRQPVKKYQKALIPKKGLLSNGQVKVPKTKVSPVEALREAEASEPIGLFFSSGRAIYYLNIQVQDISGEREGLINTARAGLTEAFRSSPERQYHTWRLSDLMWIDLNAIENDAHVLIPVKAENLAVRVSDFRKVYEFTEDLDMTSVNFLSTVSPNVFVAGSEIGQVSIVDRKLGRKTSLGFPNAVWLQSLSAHRTQDYVEVWAVSHQGGLYRWRSDSLTRMFSRVSGFPEDIQPMRIASSAYPYPVGFKAKEERGYLSNFRIGDKGSEFEQITVLGSDNRIYGLRDDLTYGFDIEVPRRWITSD